MVRRDKLVYFKFPAQKVPKDSEDCKIPGNMTGLAFHKSHLKSKDVWHAISEDELE